MAYTVDQHAAASRLAAVLADLVAGSSIDVVARQHRLPADGTSKARRLSCMLLAALERVRARRLTRGNAAQVVYALTMEGYRRFTAGQATMTHAHVDTIVREMRALGLDPGDLANKRWRKDLPAHDAPTHSAGAEPNRPLHGLCAAHAYPALADEVRAYLAPTSSVSAQARGKRLETIVGQILDYEGLMPRGPLRNPGEEIDRTFSILHMHYLLECKWEHSPVGFPDVRDFMGKVGRKAEGTFGVFLSMSGFVADINQSACHGQRLNSVGLTGVDFMNVIEGRHSWAGLVVAARRAASDRSLFVVAP